MKLLNTNQCLNILRKFSKPNSFLHTKKVKSLERYSDKTKKAFASKISSLVENSNTIISLFTRTWACWMVPNFSSNFKSVLLLWEHLLWQSTGRWPEIWNPSSLVSGGMERPLCFSSSQPHSLKLFSVGPSLHSSLLLLSSVSAHQSTYLTIKSFAEYYFIFHSQCNA